MSRQQEFLPGSIWLLSSALMCVGAGQALVFITIPPAARELGLTEIQIGLIFASSAIAWMIFSPKWGRLSDTLGRKKIVLIGLFGFAISLCLFSATINMGLSKYISGSLLLFLLIVSRMINGFLGSATRPAAGGWISDITTPDQRSRAFARLDSGFSSGRIIGPGIAGFLLLISYTLPFYIFAFLAICIGFIISLLNEKKIIIKTKKESKKLSIFNPVVFPFVIVSAALGICNASLVQTSSFYFQDVILPDSDKFLIYSSLGFMITALGFLLGQLLIADKLKTTPGTLIRTGILLISVSMFLIYFADSLISMYIPLIIYGLGAGMTGPGIAASLSLSLNKNKQGEASGLLSMVIPVGHIISPLLTMPLYQWQNSLPFLVNAIIMFSIFLFILKNKQHKWIRNKLYRNNGIPDREKLILEE